MVGDHQYFAREDSVEETWRIVQPLLDHPPDVRPTRADPGDPKKRKPSSAATRAGSSRGCPGRAESVKRTSQRVGDGVDLRIRLIGVGRLAHALAGLQGRAERAAQRRDRGGSQARLTWSATPAGWLSTRSSRLPGTSSSAAASMVMNR